MDEVNIRYVTDERDNIYYPITHMDAIEGFDMSEFEDISEIRDIADTALGEASNVSDEISSLKSSISYLQNAVSNIPSVYDTGWLNITLASGIEEYSSSNTPQARIVSVNGASFLSLRGAVKGVTSNSGVTIGDLPPIIASRIVSSLYYIQNTSPTSGKPNYSRIYINTTGAIKIEYTTIESPTDSQWFPLNQTFML